MTSIPPQQLFASAVDQYARFRTGYPQHEVDRLAGVIGLDATGTAVDIGCGTGQLTVALSRVAGRVVAIDPVPEMLAVGRRSAQAAGRANIDWVLGDSGALDRLVVPGARAATFAASFHWTDRAAVAQALDGLLDDAGSIVVIDDVLDEDDEPAWVHAMSALRRRYLGDAHTAATDRYRRPPSSHREILERSPFSAVRSVVWTWDRRLDVEQAVGLQFTYSFSTPARFGDRAAHFAADARAEILSRHPDGYVTEPFRLEVLIARRP